MLVHRSLSLTDTHADALQRALMMLASACHQAVSAVSFSSLSLGVSQLLKKVIYHYHGRTADRRTLFN